MVCGVRSTTALAQGREDAKVMLTVLQTRPVGQTVNASLSKDAKAILTVPRGRPAPVVNVSLAKEDAKVMLIAHGASARTVSV